MLGELLANQGTLRPEAEEHFQAALTSAPDYGPAFAGLAYLAERQDQHDQARELYGRAAAVKDASFATLYRAAGHLLRSDRNAVDGLPWLHRCVELAPDFGPCWALLTYAYTHQDAPPESALEVGWKAHRMFPARTDVAFNLLLLAARRDDRNTVQLLVDGYFAGLSDSEERARAEKTLMQMDLQRAWELVNAKDYDGVVGILAELEPRAAATLRAAMTEPIRQLKEAMVSKRSVERYNRALTHVEAGETEQAITLLEENLAADSGEVTVTSRELLDHLRSRSTAASKSPRKSTAQPPLKKTATKAAGLPSLQKQLNQLLAGGRLDEARQLLEQSRNAPEHVNDRFWIDHRLDQIRKTIGHNRFVVRYNKAVDLVNAKQYPEAIALLEDLVRETTDESQAADARGLLERTRAKMRR